MNAATITGSRARPIPPWWPVYMAILTLVIVVLSLFAVIGYLTDRAQDRERDRTTQTLLKCFDQYAEASATTSKAVREASIVLADATTARDVALNDVFRAVAAVPQDEARIDRTFRILLSSNAALVAAQADLAQVRVENPVPDPPAATCEA